MRILCCILLLAATGIAQAPDLRALRAKAAGGDASAMYNIAVAYYNGRTLGMDVAEDPIAAWVWFSFAAARGDAEAAVALQRLDSEFSKASLLEAHLRAGQMLLVGIEVPRDVAVAKAHVEWLRSSGTPLADVLLGYMYLSGVGAERNVKRAGELCRAAAGKGAVAGMRCAAQVAESEGDSRHAFQWFEKAAKGGDRLAMTKTAEAFANGTKGKPDKIMALAWYRCAERFGAPQAADAATALAASMTPRDVKKAEAKSRELFPLGVLVPTFR